MIVVVVVVKVVVVVVVVKVVVVVREDYRLVLKVRIFDSRNLPLRLNKILFCKSVVTIVVDLKSSEKSEVNFIKIICLEVC